MKHPYVTHGRETVEIKFLSLHINASHIEAHNIAPFLVRAKWSFEPFVEGRSFDEPDSPEWFAFDGLYAYQETVFATEEGVLVTIGRAVDLLQVLNLKQLRIIEDEIRAGWKRDAEDTAEHVYDCQRDYEYGIGG